MIYVILIAFLSLKHRHLSCEKSLVARSKERRLYLLAKPQFSVHNLCHTQETHPRGEIIFGWIQYAKKAVSSLGLVDSVLNLPGGQVKCFGELILLQRTIINPTYPKKKSCQLKQLLTCASTCLSQLAQVASCKTNFLCTLWIAHV